MYYDWLIGLGLIFGFGLALSYLSGFTIEMFLGYMTFMSAFVVWMEFLPLWVLIINLLIILFIMIGEFKSRSL